MVWFFSTNARVTKVLIAFPAVYGLNTWKYFMSYFPAKAVPEIDTVSGGRQSHIISIMADYDLSPLGTIDISYKESI